MQFNLSLMIKRPFSIFAVIMLKSDFCYILGVERWWWAESSARKPCRLPCLPLGFQGPSGHTPHISKRGQEPGKGWTQSLPTSKFPLQGLRLCKQEPLSLMLSLGSALLWWPLLVEAQGLWAPQAAQHSLTWPTTALQFTAKWFPLLRII